jgi:1-acyl-sn-glycerol-3-phosphate acyltransferase
MLRSFALLLFLPPYLLLACGFGLVVARLQGSARLLYRLARFGCRTALWIAGTRVEFVGLEPLVRDPRNVVVMPNHESNLDAPILFGLIPVDFKAVYKRELDLLPLFAQVLHFAGFIPVNRKERSAAKRAVSRAVSSLRDGSAFVIFPEGTRSRGGELQPFKMGAFHLVVNTHAPLVPMVIYDAWARVRPDSVIVSPGEITVVIHPERDTSDWTSDNLRDKAQALHADYARWVAEGPPRV